MLDGWFALQTLMCCSALLKVGKVPSQAKHWQRSIHCKISSQPKPQKDSW